MGKHLNLREIDICFRQALNEGSLPHAVKSSDQTSEIKQYLETLGKKPSVDPYDSLAPRQKSKKKKSSSSTLPHWHLQPFYVFKNTDDSPYKKPSKINLKEASQLYQDHPLIILNGNRSSGKTTYLRVVQSDAVKQYKTTRKIPLFVSLSQYKRLGDLIPLIYRSAPFLATPSSNASEPIHSLFESGELLLLLDDLHHCSPRHQKTCLHELRELLTCYPSISTIITTDVTHEVELPSLQHPPIELSLSPLDSDDRKMFLGRYIHDKSTAQQLHAEFETFITHGTSLNNILNLKLALLLFNHGKKLPDNLAQLYKVIFSIWFNNFESRLTEEEKKDWDINTLLELLSKIALKGLKQKTNTIPFDEIPQPGPLAPQDFIDVLTKIPNTFFIELKDSALSFPLKSFQEYLAAEYCIKKPDHLNIFHIKNLKEWSMIPIYVAQLKKIPQPLLVFTQKICPWLAATIEPTSKKPIPRLPAETETYKTQQHFLTALLSETSPTPSFFDLKPRHRYDRNDPILKEALANHPIADQKWKLFESRILKNEGHPARALLFLKHAITSPQELMEMTWPATPTKTKDKRKSKSRSKSKGKNHANTKPHTKESTTNGRSWQIPAFWLTNSNINFQTIQGLISLGVATENDFAKTKLNILSQAQPQQAEFWIKTHLITATDFKKAHQKKLKSFRPSEIKQWMQSGIYSVDDFQPHVHSILQKIKSISDVLAIQHTGLIPHQTLQNRVKQLIHLVSASQVKQLIKTNLIQASDFDVHNITTLLNQSANLQQIIDLYETQLIHRKQASERLSALYDEGYPSNLDYERALSANIYQQHKKLLRRALIIFFKEQENPVEAINLINSGIYSKDEWKKHVVKRLKNRASSTTEESMFKEVLAWISLEVLSPDDVERNWPELVELIPTPQLIDDSTSQKESENSSSSIDADQIKLLSPWEVGELILNKEITHNEVRFRLDDWKRIAIQSIQFTNPNDEAYHMSRFPERLTNDFKRTQIEQELKSLFFLGEIVSINHDFIFIKHSHFPNNIYLHIKDFPCDQEVLSIGQKIYFCACVQYNKKKHIYSYATHFALTEPEE